MLAEGTRRSELSELMADHVFRHIDGDEGLAVVDFKIETDEVRGDRRAARPGLDRLTAVGLLGDGDFVDEVGVDIETLFAGACPVMRGLGRVRPASPCGRCGAG